MDKPLHKLLLIVGVAFTVFVVVDSLAQIATGTGIIELMGGNQPPLLGAIARHLAGMPAWLFFVIVAVSVVVLSSLISLSVISQYKKEIGK